MTTITEKVRPIPILAPTTPFRKILWKLRLLADLQLASTVRDLTPFFRSIRGQVVDVGCGDMPFRHLISDKEVHYIGCDIHDAQSGFGYDNKDVVRFDGTRLPFTSDSIDYVICTEVLEHHPERQTLLHEIHRILKTGGKLALTVPWSARVHFAPNDFLRYTPYELRRMFAKFSSCEISARGTDISAICNKLIVVLIRAIKESARFKLLSFLALLTMIPFIPFILIFGQVSITRLIGSEDDPLGYTVIAIK